MLGKVCILKDDVKKEKYIIFNSLYSNEVLDIIGINENNKGKIIHLRGDTVELEEESQKILDKL
jgi:hypothetical protein